MFTTANYVQKCVIRQCRGPIINLQLLLAAQYKLKHLPGRKRCKFFPKHLLHNRRRFLYSSQAKDLKTVTEDLVPSPSPHIVFGKCRPSVSAQPTWCTSTRFSLCSVLHASFLLAVLHRGMHGGLKTAAPLVQQAGRPPGYMTHNTGSILSQGNCQATSRWMKTFYGIRSVLNSQH